MVIDDNATNRRILERMLSTWGMIVDLSASGAEALALLYQAVNAHLIYPLIIVDGQMPHMDALTLLRRIREARELKVGNALMKISQYALKPVARSDLLRLFLLALRNESTQEPAMPSPAAGRPLHILSAKDSLFNQKVAFGMLATDGHTVTVANNGLEAVEAFSKQAFDLVFMDLQMPVMDGQEATERIRRQQRISGMRVPIIAMTAHAMAGDRERCLAAGMDDYISKPIGRDELAAVVARNTDSAAYPVAITP